MTQYFITLCFLIFTVFTLNAQTVSTVLVKPNAQFEGITWLPDGRIYVVDFATGEVFRITTTGVIERITRLNGALGGAADSENNYYVSEFSTGNIIKIDPAENISVYARGLVGPAGILIDDAAEVMYVANYSGSSISSIDMQMENPTPTTLASGGRINGPDGLAFAPNGDLISCNFDDNNIQRITRAGVVSPFATLADSPNSGYIVRVGDRYIVTGAFDPNIYSISLTGAVRAFRDTSLAGYADGDIQTAQFRFPNGITASPNGDTLLVTESTTAGQIRMITNLNGTSSTDILQSVQSLRIHPNPASEQVRIQLHLPERSDLQIQLLDLQSNVVDTFVMETTWQGDFEGTFNLPTQLSASIYFVQIRAGKELLHYTLLVK
ncbi:MAG: SMP-30/gluconolactonase/LRE family protein [Bacteroidota bacterium]